LGVFLLPILPLAIDYAIEISFPVGEGLSVGMNFLINYKKYYI